MHCILALVVEFYINQEVCSEFFEEKLKTSKIESVIPHLHGQDGLSFFFTTQLADEELSWC